MPRTRRPLSPKEIEGFKKAILEKKEQLWEEIKKDLREKSIEKVEKIFIAEALKRNEWNISRAASDVGMQRSNFQALIKKHRISRPK